MGGGGKGGKLRHTGNKIAYQPLGVVVANPLQEGEERNHVIHDLTASGNEIAQLIDSVWYLLDIVVVGEDRLSPSHFVLVLYGRLEFDT